MPWLHHPADCYFLVHCVVHVQPPWFAPRLRAHFAEHPGLALEIKDGDVAIWIPHTLSSGPYRRGWNRSFRTVDDWCRDDLTLMLEAAETLLADPSE